MNLYTTQKNCFFKILLAVRKKGGKNLWKILFLFSFILIGNCFYIRKCDAATNAIITGASSLNIRSGPGTSYDNVMADDNTKITLPNGYNVSIVGEAYDNERNLWYKISFTYRNATYEGYAMATYIKERNSVGSESNFEEYLTQQGFPESYKEKLRTLHSAHPKWIFEAFHTGLEWQRTVNAESEVGKNLIQNNVISSWKSMENGAYNWDTNTWVVFDGADWVAASKELITYYLDPRNFLDESNIFMFETLSYDNSYQTASGVQSILSGSFMSGTYTDTDGWSGSYAEAFIYAAEQSGVSPYHLASRSLQELSPSGSSSVSGTVSGYEGYYNFYNIGATSSSNPILNGLAFAKQYNDTYFLPWNAKWKAIAGGAIYLGKRYINVGQDTLYLQKFNVQGSSPYTHQYMTNVQAASSEAKKMAVAYGNTGDREIVFKIPIFENMPNTISPLPTGSGSSVAVLSELSIKGYTLTPTFNKNVTEYDLVLNEIISSVEVSAKAADSSSSVSGTGTHKLQEGSNNIKIVVTAPSGNTTTYTIHIVVPLSKPNTNGSSSNGPGSNGNGPSSNGNGPGSNGETISDKPGTPEQTTTSNKPTTPEQTTTSNKPETPEQTTTSNKPETPEQTTAPDKPGTPEQTTSSDKPTTPEQTTSSDNPTTSGEDEKQITISAKGKKFMTLKEKDKTTTVIYGFDVGVEAAEAVKSITATNCSVQILNSDRTPNTSIIATGNIVQIKSNKDNAIISELLVVIYGDVNGDGQINAKDMLYLQQHLLGIITLNGVYAEAGDINWAADALDSKGVKTTQINAQDILHLKRHLLDIKYITQK